MYRRVSIGDLKIGPEERRAVMDVLRSQRISEGPKVAEFEKRWAAFVGTKYSLAVNSGASALICSLTALKYLYGLKKKPKVITSPLTYIADASALSVSGFEPAFVDVNKDSLCIDAYGIEKHLKQAKDGGKYSIIMPVDLMGYSPDYSAIKQVAKKYGLIILEDAAQAHGSTCGKLKAGANGDLGIFSFYIAHNIQVGEMGAITTDNLQIYRMAKKIKTQGRECDCLICTRSKGRCPKLANRKSNDDFDPRFSHSVIGYNFKTMEFQASLALVQLKKIKNIVNKRRENVAYLNAKLRRFDGLLKLPDYSNSVSYLAYPLVIKDEKAISRKALRMGLEKAGIETRPLFGCIPMHQQAYSYLKREYAGKLPNAEYAGRNGFYIGCHQYLNKPDLDHIVEVFHKLLKGLL